MCENAIINELYKALSDKKGEDIKVIDIKNISIMADYFVLVSGANEPQLNALVDAAVEVLSKAKVPEIKVEGSANTGWVLMDAGDVIIHVFSRQNRDFYNLERIWKDGIFLDMK